MLIKSYKDNQIFKSIALKIKEKESNINLQSLSGSLKSIFINYLYNQLNYFFLIIAENFDRAEQLYSDLYSLNNIHNPTKLMFYPNNLGAKLSEREKQAILRKEVISSLFDDHQKIILTHPEALILSVENKNEIKEKLFTFHINQKISINLIKEIFTDLNYNTVEFVSTTSEIAFRGGIIDLFPQNSQVPYRIELLGNTIESIRILDIVTQLSEKNIQKFTIIKEKNNNKKSDSNSTILNLFPQETLIIKDGGIDFRQVHQEILKENKNIISNISDFVKLINSKKTLVFNKKKFSISYNSNLNINYNHQFNLLKEDLKSYLNQGFKIFFDSNTLSQSNNLIKIVNKEIDNHDQILPTHLSLSNGFIDNDSKIICFCEHQITNKYFKLQSPTKFSRKNIVSIKELYKIKLGDFVVHIDHGISKFGGITYINNNNKKQEVIKLIFKNNDIVYVNIQNIHKILKYSATGNVEPRLSKIGTTNWQNKKSIIKSKIKEIAIDLISLYSKRKSEPGYSFKKDSSYQIALESSFIYQDTPDQAKATQDVKKDMESIHPMDRLICGDVGFGKTEIAIRAAFKAVVENKQVAILVPTTILALQHFNSFNERLKEFGVVVDYINRFKTSAQKTKIKNELKQGIIDIIIGTHAIINKKYQFKDLGLLIIDEEQKFGVTTKEKIKEIKSNIDVLTLTATPIPRTLQFSLMGARDLSIISTPPPNRQPIDTSLNNFNLEIIKNAIERELLRNGQVFFVNNRIKNLEILSAQIKKIVPEAKINIAHGQLKDSELEKKLLEFIGEKYNVLISTNIIESGLDIPNANTIIINDAQNYGLSDLHQMRGRVGRSNIKAYCYLLVPSILSLSNDAQKRLSALEEFSDIGEGFKIAMKDLDIRGAGNLLGGEQSGFIGDIGFEMYNKILNEAINEINNKRPNLIPKKNIFHESSKECNLETNFEASIPQDYIRDQSDRVNYYLKFEKFQSIEKIPGIIKEFEDKYGQTPIQLKNFVKLIEIKILAKKVFITKIKHKENFLKLTFDINEGDFKKVVDKIINLIHTDLTKYSLQENETNAILKVKNVRTIDDIKNIITKIQN